LRVFLEGFRDETRLRPQRLKPQCEGMACGTGERVPLSRTNVLSGMGFLAAGAKALLLAIATMPGLVCAGQVAGGPAAASGAAATTGAQVSLDRVVAIVNGDLILQSDVDAEVQMAAFQPFSDSKPATQDELIARLIDRTLIVQQMALEREPPVTDAEVGAELASLRKTIPKCALSHCETDKGWERFVREQGFTVDELRERWRQRMEVLRFIEQRFRMGIRITQGEIDDYYKTTLIPAYQKQNTPTPPEPEVAERIQEILLQQRVDKLLDDWLLSLRAEGSVRMMNPGEDAP
jgi:peptidyl-prolyl cis-trans isomerase SurA